MIKQSATDSMGYDDNPGGRPKKYASAAERQAAYRARASEIGFRADSGTVETLSRIAETIDVPRTDLLLSMVKFALANHDWARFGLTHKTLPKYKDNPIMATAAQIAARKRFAEMAKSGAFAKTRKPARNPVKTVNKARHLKTEKYAGYTIRDQWGKVLDTWETKAMAISEAQKIADDTGKSVIVVRESFYNRR